MKIRLQDNHVTIRLNEEDQKELMQKGILRAAVEFPHRPLFAYLETMDIPEITGDFTEEGLQFFFPVDTLDSWLESSRIGFRSQVGKVTLIIEKDLPKRNRKE